MRNRRQAKHEYRALFLALQADAKKYPGGIRALAEIIGVNGSSLANNLNPDHESLPPSFATIIEVIIHAQGKSSVFAISQFVGQVPMDIEIDCDDDDEKSHIKHFLTLVSSASELLKNGSDAAKDLRFDAHEKQQMRPLLIELIKVSAQLYRSIEE